MKTKLRTQAALLLALPLALAGCAAVNDATMRALATPVPALAVVGERVLKGEAMLYTDRSGKLTLESGGDNALSCMGAMRYTSSTGGIVNLRCSDGAQAQLSFTALGEMSGHARGNSAQGTVSLTYGLDPEPARAWLTPPAGKRLVVSGSSLRLE